MSRLNIPHLKRINPKFVYLSIDKIHHKWKHDYVPIWGISKGYRILKIASSNGGSINNMNSQLNLARQCKKYEIDITGIQETNFTTDVEKLVEDYFLIGSKATIKENEAPIAGVGVLIH